MIDAASTLDHQHERLDDRATWLRRLDEVSAALQDALDRTVRLLRPLPAELWHRSPDEVMGPVAWDAAHMGNQEDIWLHQHLHGSEPLEPGSNDTYHAYRHPRAVRGLLPLKAPDALFDYRARIRERTLARLKELRDAPPSDVQDRWEVLYLHWLVALHEQQHTETICQTLHLFSPKEYLSTDHTVAPVSSRANATELVDRFIFHEGGPFLMGSGRRFRTYDNEWTQHEVDVEPFWLAATPVTNGEWLRFIDAGGYDAPDHWDATGHAKLLERGWRHPVTWVPTPQGWLLREGDRLLPLPLERPVMGITWYEADAYARWRGLRLPTEPEWEFAATTAPDVHEKMSHPWGEDPPGPEHGNLDQRRWGTDPVGSHEAGASRRGVHQLIGDVWEWTATEFQPYPGFEAYPYREYSAAFFDQGLKVLRGGSWATRPGLRLGTFRNWDLPIRRQNFAGVRLAADERPPAAHDT